jgi:hypothetical protein
MSPTAHDTDLYTLGKGILSFDRFDADGLPQGLRDLGNAPDFALTPVEETLEHFSSRGGIKTRDVERTLQRKLNGKFTLEEYDKDNLKLALFSDEVGYAIEPMTAGDIIGQLDFVMTNDVGPKYHVQLWNVKLKPSGDIAFISEDWGKIGFEFAVQDDSANHPNSPYGLITPLSES